MPYNIHIQIRIKGIIPHRPIVMRIQYSACRIIYVLPANGDTCHNLWNSPPQTALAAPLSVLVSAV